jgi:hypothetical protein
MRLHHHIDMPLATKLNKSLIIETVINFLSTSYIIAITIITDEYDTNINDNSSNYYYDDDIKRHQTNRTTGPGWLFHTPAWRGIF